MAESTTPSSPSKPPSTSIGTERVWRFLFPYIYAPLALYSLINGRNGGYSLLAVPVFSFVFVPVLDLVCGIDPFNPDKAVSGVLHNDNRFSAITCIWTPIHCCIILLGLLCVNEQNLIGLIFSVGFTSGIVGITFAHELMHKTSRIEIFLANVIMHSVSYPHYCIEHVQGHHKNVATTHDPASSRFGESFYRFLPRTVIGSLISAWDIEVKRLHKMSLNTSQILIHSNTSQTPLNIILNPNNRLIRFAVVMSALYSAVYYLFGLRGLIFFVFQGCVAFTSLEVVNYIEHYGLMRKELSPGVYEQVQPKHSWNSGSRMTNYLLVNLGRHSDHHFNSSKRYQLLINETDTAPQLPFGYAVMFVVALFPPIWFAIMNPRCTAWNEKITKMQ